MPDDTPMIDDIKKEPTFDHLFPSIITPEPAVFIEPLESSKKQTTIAQQVENDGEVKFRVIENNQTAESMQLLTGLKNIFQRQLPKMPKEYISRLAYDRNHVAMAVVRDPLIVLGGMFFWWVVYFEGLLFDRSLLEGSLRLCFVLLLALSKLKYYKRMDY